MAAISYHGTVHDVQAIEWEPLAPAARREGLAALEQGVAQPVYAVAEDASGGVVFPLQRAGRRLEALRERHAAGWRPLATAYASADSLSIALAGDLATRASHVVLDRVPDEDGTARQLERAFAKAGWIVARRPCEDASDHDGPLYRVECWRRSDPRNWPSLARRKIRALVSPSPRG
ncbi:MAG: hypothetical protein ACO1OD_07045 [Croceibacterium sp.]